MYADIIVDITHEQLDKVFQYRVPSELEDMIEVGMLVNIPFGSSNKVITGYVVNLTEIPSFDIMKIKPVYGIVSGKVQAVGRMIKLAGWLKYMYGSTMNQAIRTVIPVKDKVKQKEKKIVKLISDKENTKRLLEEYETKKNAVARAKLLSILMDNPVMDADVIKSQYGISQSTINTLHKSGVIDVIVENLYRNPYKKSTSCHEKLILNEEQRILIDSFVQDYDRGIRKTYLIHGVTGSGKTVCYMDMIEHVVKSGKQAIVLIPEIALTYQTVQRFYNRFGDAVSVMNSRMSKGERYDQFMRAMRGEISIMIGPRSALFTPFSDIGLIVIDEEHENAYKSEVTPKYHARETAEHISKECNASLVLGSATPSIEAYYRALCNEISLFELKNRAMGSKLAKTHIVDLRKELKEGNRSIFSVKLQELIRDRLSKKEQIMLFLNKRGYAGFISCRSCGHVMKCPHCDISLTEHKNGKLMCHYCGYEQNTVAVCPECGSKYIMGFKAGTQQVEDAVKKMFPTARVLRMDMDTTSGKEGHERILSVFNSGMADILVGTQMIVKGHDFPNVTLVGVLAADMSLNMGDYRSAARTFQLIVQAAGRAGRSSKAGEAVIQTYSPAHYSITTAAAQDYKAFYDEEIAYRRIMGYPPVSNMLVIGFTSKNEAILQQVSDSVKGHIKELLCDGQTADGPVPAGIYKINDEYTRYMHIRGTTVDDLIVARQRIEAFIRGNTAYGEIYLQYDFN